MLTKPMVVAALSVSAALTFAPRAEARPTVAVTRVEVPARADAARLGHELKQLLADAARRSNFGKGSAKERVEFTARLVEFGVEQRGDVLQVRCTLAGRIKGGHGARSRISFGGNPMDRVKLEHDVLRMVANGLVSRLSEISRAERRAAAGD